MAINLDNRGFSLAEMLVAVGVFAVTMAISSSIFINVNNLQQQTANLAQLQNEGRYVLEKISKEIRGREIDYGGLELDAEGFTAALPFKEDEFGEAMRLYFDATEGRFMMESASVAGGNRTAALSSDDVKVERLTFKIAPATDPFDEFSGTAPTQQPRVTIRLEISNRAAPERFRKSLVLQTTISSKIYR